MPFWNAKQEDARQEDEPATGREESRTMGMIKRDELPTSLGGTSDLLLGPGAQFEGKLNFKGTVRIDAKLTGSIVTDDVLIVGEHARIDADITCGSVIVHGQVNGNIKAKVAVELHHPAKVHGDVETPSLTVEQGVVLQGAIKMDGVGQARDGLPPASAKPAATPAMVAVK